MVETGIPEVRGRQDDRGGTGFGGEAVDRLQLHHLVAEGPDDAPAADGGASSHRQGANHFDPHRDFHFLAGEGLRACAEMTASRAGGRRCPALVAASRVRAMMPMVFCASLVPCMKPIPAALSIWASAEKPIHPERAAPVAEQQIEQRHEHEPQTIPQPATVNIGTITFATATLCPETNAAGFRLDQMITSQLLPRSRQRGAAQPADQGMAGAGGQAQPPGEQVPDDRTKQRADHDAPRHDKAGHQPGPEAIVSPLPCPTAPRAGW